MKVLTYFLSIKTKQMSNISNIKSDDYSLIYDNLPSDTSKQTYAMKEVKRIIKHQFRYRSNIKVLDLGCGDGNSIKEFKNNVTWLGLDIKDSPEMSSKIIEKNNITIYDGTNIPLKDNSMDIIFSRQVLEHVRHPEKLLYEVHRVLKIGGYFIGSTSHLEPFHSRSLWNFTPYGIVILLRTAGFNNIIIRPGIDGLTLIVRRLFAYIKMANLFNCFIKIESPMNLIFEFGLKILGINVRKRNAIKLLFSGHVVFIGGK